MPAPPNPYFIYIELVWPDGHNANQNEIARVIAYDVNGAVVTNEGQSGYDPGTGGWQPIFMQNIAAFYPPREKPNLRFEVVSTQEVSLFTTQVFNNIASGTTVRIVIGQGASIPGGGGGGPTTFTVTGHARRQSNGGAFFPGAVEIFDVTNNSPLSLGATVLATDGGYSVSFNSDQFKNNGGVFHTRPNLLVKLTDVTTGQLLAESGPHPGWNGQPNRSTRRRHGPGAPAAQSLRQRDQRAWSCCIGGDGPSVRRRLEHHRSQRDSARHHRQRRRGRLFDPLSAAQFSGFAQRLRARARSGQPAGQGGHADDDVASDVASDVHHAGKRGRDLQRSDRTTRRLGRQQDGCQHRLRVHPARCRYIGLLRRSGV